MVADHPSQVGLPIVEAEEAHESHADYQEAAQHGITEAYVYKHQDPEGAGIGVRRAT